MRVIIVVEGDMDRRVLERVLDDLKGSAKFKFVVAHGRDAGRPIARRLLLEPENMVVFVYDADTSDEDEANSDQKALMHYFGRSGASGNVLVQPFIPELESIFFEVPDALESTLGMTVDPSLLSAGRFAPKRILSDLLKHSKIRDVGELIAKCDKSALSELRHVKSLDAIRTFVLDAAAPLRR